MKVNRILRAFVELEDGDEFIVRGSHMYIKDGTGIYRADRDASSPRGMPAVFLGEYDWILKAMLDEDIGTCWTKYRAFSLD